MLREMWLNIGVKKIDTYESVIIKVLLDSSATGMFMDRQTAARHGFELQKLERLIAIRNVDGTNNNRGAITHQVECNILTSTGVEQERSEPEWSGIAPEWVRLTTIRENNLGLSSCAVPRSTVACVVAYFRRTELLSGTLERNGMN